MWPAGPTTPSPESFLGQVLLALSGLCALVTSLLAAPVQHRVVQRGWYCEEQPSTVPGPFLPSLFCSHYGRMDQSPQSCPHRSFATGVHQSHAVQLPCMIQLGVPIVVAAELRGPALCWKRRCPEAARLRRG